MTFPDTKSTQPDDDLVARLRSYKLVITGDAAAEIIRLRTIVAGQSTQPDEFEGHTPGPWTVKQARDDGGGWHICAGDIIVARIFWDGEKENADLMAAAPGLLAERNQLRAAVAELVEGLEARAKWFEKMYGQQMGASGNFDAHEFRALVAKHRSGI